MLTSTQDLTLAAGSPAALATNFWPTLTPPYLRLAERYFGTDMNTSWKQFALDTERQTMADFFASEAASGSRFLRQSLGIESPAMRPQESERDWLLRVSGILPEQLKRRSAAPEIFASLQTPVDQVKRVLDDVLAADAARMQFAILANAETSARELAQGLNAYPSGDIQSVIASSIRAAAAMPVWMRDAAGQALDASFDKHLQLLEGTGAIEASRALAEARRELLGLTRHALGLLDAPAADVAPRRSVSDLHGSLSGGGSSQPQPVARVTGASVALPAGADPEVQWAIRALVISVLVQVLCTALAPYWDYYSKEIIIRAYLNGAVDREAKKEAAIQLQKLDLPAPYRSQRRIVARDLAARLNPRSRSPIVASLGRGVLVVVLRVDGDWTHVEFQSNGTTSAGWVYSRYLNKL